MRHLENNELASHLDGGRPVEQLLESRMEGEDRILRLLRIDREPDGRFSVACVELVDEGNEDFLDVYAFAACDPDRAHGDITPFGTAQEAIEFAASKYGAHPDDYVNAGSAPDEYADRYFQKQDSP